ncbi:hypothetical protein COCC4DRAFT_61111 [Bipolaris maydis ATCC 48331]|uniref:Secreted protein n=2 Tax=Cochliobolus heterostrophus TaxID=5016 RepID=M2UM40_COCH5|nr:uncharacterized protein COCC4DRAFT_61111 [Bipolaris maydis ATCC 48331]EMD89002.1 hypothetical protein COCHEDRAFT_1157832 [Bipolaris maydis C5]ENI05279.1 hypothetical protein COCC4DRAFT_61111 [Bipolaris maydis ATCC 48331]KAJ6212380.1 hypothetical protein PSV09DRAFT_1157832 [Bipolaris maydis]
MIVALSTHLFMVLLHIVGLIVTLTCGWCPSALPDMVMHSSTTAITPLDGNKSKNPKIIYRDEMIGTQWDEGAIEMWVPLFIPRHTRHHALLVYGTLQLPLLDGRLNRCNTHLRQQSNVA